LKPFLLETLEKISINVLIGGLYQVPKKGGKNTHRQSEELTGALIGCAIYTAAVWPCWRPHALSRKPELA
jgi:hypothetical protein